jgi:hypothetical protein
VNLKNHDSFWSLKSLLVEWVDFSLWLTLNHTVDLENIWFAIYGNNFGNHMVDVDDAIVTRCVEPKARVPRGEARLLP